MDKFNEWFETYGIPLIDKHGVFAFILFACFITILTESVALAAGLYIGCVIGIFLGASAVLNRSNKT